MPVLDATIMTRIPVTMANLVDPIYVMAHATQKVWGPQAHSSARCWVGNFG